MRSLLLATLLISGFSAHAAEVGGEKAPYNEALFYTAEIVGEGYGDFSLSKIFVSSDGKTALVKTGTFESSMSRYDVVNQADGRTFTLVPNEVNTPNWTTGDYSKIDIGAMSSAFKADAGLTIALVGETANTLADAFKVSGKNIQIIKEGHIELAPGHQIATSAVLARAVTTDAGLTKKSFPGEPTEISQAVRPRGETRATEQQMNLFEERRLEDSSRMREGSGGRGGLEGIKVK